MIPDRACARIKVLQREIVLFEPPVSQLPEEANRARAIRSVDAQTMLIISAGSADAAVSLVTVYLPISRVELSSLLRNYCRLTNIIIQAILKWNWHSQ